MAKHLYIVETERRDDDGCWMVEDELDMTITRGAGYLIECAKRYPLEVGQRICVRQVADDVDWRTVEEIYEGITYKNVYVREG